MKRALAILSGCDLPLAEWRVHATAAQVRRRRGNVREARRHLESSRAVIERLSGSLPDHESLRNAFLRAPIVRAIIAGV